MSTMWTVLGFMGQAAFSARFLVQWLASEREGRSVVPPQFWFFSLVGSVLLLSYALHRRDPVFILGQAAGILIYVRNIYLLHRESRARSS